jgi:hypothetical protein
MKMLSMNAYSKDLRVKVLSAIDRGIPRKRRLRFSSESPYLPSSAGSTEDGRRGTSTSTTSTTSTTSPADHRSKARLSEGVAAFLELKRNPDLTLGEHCEALEEEMDVRVSQATMSRQIARLPGGWPLKKSRR